jgi:DNA-binding transcriptional MocR family regulator
VLGRRVLEIPVCPDRGMDLDQLESLLQRHNVSALVLNPAYSNPTGHCYSDEHKSQICHIVSRLDIPLIEDDVFAELGHGFNRPKTIFSFDHQGRVLLCSSFSKSLSQDLRVGWLVPGRYFLKARDYKYASTLGTSSLQQWALADFLQGKQYERHLQSVSINYGKKLCLFKEMIKELFPKETKMTQPKGGYLSWIKLPGSLDSLRLYDLALQQGISITPGRLFSVSPRFNNYIRLNFASLPPEKMHRALTELACLISQAS